MLCDKCYEELKKDNPEDAASLRKLAYPSVRSTRSAALRLVCRTNTCQELAKWIEPCDVALQETEEEEEETATEKFRKEYEEHRDDMKGVFGVAGEIIEDLGPDVKAVLEKYIRLLHDAASRIELSEEMAKTQAKNYARLFNALAAENFTKEETMAIICRPRVF
jgi:putative cell wall-binding protein